MLDFMNELLEQFLNFVLSVLPLSPFTDIINELEALPYLGYLNWVIPIGKFIKIGTGWLTAIGLFYMYQIILRWIKAIE